MDEKSSRTSQTFIVGAIDFGTSNSGWACSFFHDFETDPTKSYVPNWNSGGKLVTTKAPTCVLIDKENHTLVEFGYDAENRFIDLVENGDEGNYYFFKEFKMALNKKIKQVFDRTLTIKDMMDNVLPAMKVFSLTIAYLVNDLISEMNLKVTGDINKGDVKWVLTVPAIWTDSSKQFMTEAALRVGIPEDKLLIALEPEVASLYCQHVPLDSSLAERQTNTSRFQIGTRYMVLDAGEIYQDFASGKRKTNSQNTKSREVMKTFVTPCKTDKDVATTQGVADQHDIKDHIKASKFGDQIKFKSDKFRIHPSLMKGFFSKSIEKIVHRVKSLLQHTKVKDITAILMVGGYSESPMLQDAIKSNFPDLQVVIPGDSASAVLRGAVIFGFVPDSIACRVLKYTYGYEASNPFEEGVHPEEKKIVNDHGVRCSDCFNVYARKHQTVKLGEEPVVNSLTPQYSTQKSLNISIYATRSKPPVIVNQSLTKIGELHIELDDHDGDINREISFSMSFDRTTIKAQAKDEKTGKSVKASLNFLG